MPNENNRAGGRDNSSFGGGGYSSRSTGGGQGGGGSGNWNTGGNLLRSLPGVAATPTPQANVLRRLVSGMPPIQQPLDISAPAPTSGVDVWGPSYPQDPSIAGRIPQAPRISPAGDSLVGTFQNDPTRYKVGGGPSGGRHNVTNINKRPGGMFGNWSVRDKINPGFTP